MARPDRKAPAPATRDSLANLRIFRRATGDTAGWLIRVSVTGNAPIEAALPCDLVLTGSGYADTVLVPVVVGDSMNLPDGPTPCGLALFDHTDSTFAALHDELAVAQVVGAPPLGLSLEREQHSVAQNLRGHRLDVLG